MIWMKSVRVAALGLAFVGLMGLPRSFVAAAEVAKPRKQKLKSTTLVVPGGILTPADRRVVADESSAGAGAPAARARLVDGIIVPGHQKTFSQEVTIAGQTFQMFFANKLTLAGENDTHKPKAKGVAFTSVKLNLPDQQKYTVAFPFSEQDKAGKTVYYRSGLLARGKVKKFFFALYDDNLDGQYTAGVDCYRTGGSRVFASLGRLIPTPKGLLEIKNLSADGKSITLAPSALPARKFRVDYPVSSVEGHFVFTASISAAEGDDAGKFTFSYKTGDKPIFVPIGVYRYDYGFAYNTRQSRIIALVVPGETTKAVEVKEKADLVVKMGQPIRLQFTARYAGGKVQIDPAGFRIFGAAGEEYLSYEFVVPPAVSVTNLRTGVSNGVGSFKRDTSGDLLSMDRGIPLDVRKGGGGYQVQVKAIVNGFGPVIGLFGGKQKKNKKKTK